MYITESQIFTYHPVSQGKCDFIFLHWIILPPSFCSTEEQKKTHLSQALPFKWCLLPIYSVLNIEFYLLSLSSNDTWCMACTASLCLSLFLSRSIVFWTLLVPSGLLGNCNYFFLDYSHLERALSLITDMAIPRIKLLWPPTHWP